MVVVGTILTFKTTYVVVNNVWFETANFLDTLDLAFKAFFSLDAEYPEESINIWQFVQLCIYDIPLPPKGISIKVKAIAEQISEVLRRHETQT